MHTFMPYKAVQLSLYCLKSWIQEGMMVYTQNSHDKYKKSIKTFDGHISWEENHNTKKNTGG